MLWLDNADRFADALDPPLLARFVDADNWIVGTMPDESLAADSTSNDLVTFLDPVRYQPLTRMRLTAEGEKTVQDHYPNLDLSAGLGIASTSITELANRWITSNATEQRLWRALSLIHI